MDDLRLDRMKVFLLVFLAWVVMYLPALGARELRGEEGRRTLPAVTMVKTGNWLVPHVGGQEYHRKPPMINWLVAASFVLTGEQSERSARLPSVLFILAFVVLLVWFPGAWPSIEARLISAVLFLTSFTMIEKGRQIEIEGVYIALTSMAVVSWLILWTNRCGSKELPTVQPSFGLDTNPQPAIRNPQSPGSEWALWLVPGVFLACGMLTKGPPILVFFYAPVIGVLAYSRRLRALVSLSHVVAIVLYLGLPAAWLAAARAASVQTSPDMTEELVMRLTTFGGSAGEWAQHVLKSFANLLPWILFVPLLWRRGFLAHLPPQRLPLLKGARLGLVIAFLGISLIPGNSGRYALPVLGLMSILLGWVLSAARELPDQGRLWRGGILAGFAGACVTAVAGMIGVNANLWAGIVLCATVCLAVLLFRERMFFRTPVRLAVLSLVLGATFMFQYPLFAIPLMARNESRRPVGATVSSLVPAGQTVYLFQPGYQLFLFYVREPLEYLNELGQIDERVRFLILREEKYQHLQQEPALARRGPRTLYCFKGHKSDYRLLELLPPAAKTAAQSRQADDR